MVDALRAGLSQLEVTCLKTHGHLADHREHDTTTLLLHASDALFVDPWRHVELRVIVLATLLLTLAAELVSYRSVRSILSHNGLTLYLKAVGLCVFNTVALGPLTLALVTLLGLLRPPRSSPHDQHSLEWRFAWMMVDANEALFLVMLHSLGSMAPPFPLPTYTRVRTLQGTPPLPHVS